MEDEQTQIIITNKIFDLRTHERVMWINSRKVENWKAIQECRGYGAPEKAFGDTMDKVVITPRHLPYSPYQVNTDEFEIEAASDDWGWHKSVSLEKRKTCNEKLFTFAQTLADNYKEADVELVQIFGSCKGYVDISNTPISAAKFSDFEDESFVVWVYNCSLFDNLDYEEDIKQEKSPSEIDASTAQVGDIVALADRPSEYKVVLYGPVPPGEPIAVMDESGETDLVGANNQMLTRFGHIDISSDISSIIRKLKTNKPKH